MSTKQRYGNAVWDAIAKLTDHRLGQGHVWVTVGEVAKEAGVSKPTARKYLNALWEMGDVLATVVGGKVGYRAKIVRGY